MIPKGILAENLYLYISAWCAVFQKKWQLKKNYVCPIDMKAVLFL